MVCGGVSSWKVCCAISHGELTQGSEASFNLVLTHFGSHRTFIYEK